MPSCTSRVACAALLLFFLFTSGTAYSFKRSTSFPTAWVDEGYAHFSYVTEVDVNLGGEYILSRSSNTEEPFAISNQVYTQSSSLPKTWFNQQYSNGFMISSAAYDETRSEWVFFMSRVDDWAYQYWTYNSTFPQDFIASKFKVGAYITEITYGGGYWFVAMTTTASGVSTPWQKWWWNTAFPSSALQTALNDGYFIDKLRFKKDRFVLVMTWYRNQHDMQYWYKHTSSFPISDEDVERLFEKPYSATDAGFRLSSVGPADGGYGWVVSVAAGSLPTTFDGRSQWSDAVSFKMIDQEICGSCYAWAVLGSFYDRLSLAGLERGAAFISPQTLLSCSKSYGNDGCNGGYLIKSWLYHESFQATTCSSDCRSGCLPYTSGQCVEGRDSERDGCSDCESKQKCGSGSPFSTTFKPMFHRRVNAGSVESIQREIATNGPVPVCWQMYDNFLDFFQANPKGIYSTTSGGTFVGGHCTKLVGWGSEGGVDYWISANTWGPSFADGGYFKFLRGANLAGIEDWAVAGYVGALSSSYKEGSVGGSEPLFSTSALREGVEAGGNRDRLPTSESDKPADEENEPKGGGWVDVPLDSADVSHLSSHIVSASWNADSEFSIVRAQSQVVRGVRYRLTLSHRSRGNTLFEKFAHKEVLIPVPSLDRPDVAPVATS